MAAPPPPPSQTASSGGSGGISYTQRTDTDGSVTGVPGTIYQRASNGSISVIKWGETPQAGRDPSGYDPATGLPYGVVRVSTDVSPTGLVYQGIPVNPDGSRYVATAAAEKPPDLVSIGGKPYIWDPNTDKFIPAPVAGGGPVQPQTYSGGGGYSAPRDPAAEAAAEIAIVKARAAADAANDQAQAQIRKAEMAFNATLQKELLAMQQAGTSQENARDRAFQSAVQAWNSQVTNVQLKIQQDEQRRQMANDFVAAASSTDPLAVQALLKAWGSFGNIIASGASALSENALTGAAALLELIRKPYETVPEFSFTEPGAVGGLSTTTGTGGVTGATGGSGATPDVPGLSTGVGGTTEADPISALSDELDQVIQGLAQQSMLSNQQRLYKRDDGSRGMTVPVSEQGTPVQTGNFSGMWQSVDPYAPNYKPPYEGYEIPGTKYDYTTGTLQPDTGLTQSPFGTGGVSAPAQGDGVRVDANGNPIEPVVVPGLAGGGSFRGVAVVGERGPELMIAPQGADVIPLTGPTAGQFLNRGIPGLAYGTLSGGTLSRTRTTQPTYAEPATQPVSGLSTTQQIPYSQPVQQAIPQPAPLPQPAPVQQAPVVGSVATQPTSTQAPVPPVSSSPAPAPTTPITAQQLATTGTNPQPDQMTLDEIRQMRENTVIPELPLGITGPQDVRWGSLPPSIREAWLKATQSKFGLPAGDVEWEAGRMQVPGLSRTQFALGV